MAATAKTRAAGSRNSVSTWFYVNGYGLPSILQQPYVIGAFGWAISGWVVGRLHRPYALSMVLSTGTAIALLSGGGLVWGALNQPGELATLVAMYVRLLGALLLPFAIGGMFSARRSANSPVHGPVG